MWDLLCKLGWLTNKPQKFTCLCFIHARIVNAHHQIPLLEKDFIFIILIMCVYVCVPPRMQWGWKPEEDIGPLGLGLEVGVSCLV